MEKQVNKVYDVAGGDVSIAYTATLKTATESVTIDIDPSRVTSSPETKIFEATQKMWAFMVKQDVASKLHLEDVYEVATEAVANE